MSEYQLHVPNEHEAFLIGIRLSINQDNGISKCDVTETKDGTVFLIRFKDEDDMYAFDKKMKSSLPFLFK